MVRIDADHFEVSTTEIDNGVTPTLRGLSDPATGDCTVKMKETGTSVTTSDHNTALGARAGGGSLLRGCRNLFLGAYAGHAGQISSVLTTSTINDALVISTIGESTSHRIPLISGDFAGNRVGINCLPGTGLGSDEFLAVRGTPSGLTAGAKLLAVRATGTTAVGFNSSAAITLADDSATWIEMPVGTTTAIVCIVTSTGSGGASNKPSGIYRVRYDSTSQCSPILFEGATAVNSTTGTNIVTTTGIFAGTTGGDGNFTLSAHTNGRVYFENRTGGSKTFAVTFLSIH